MLVNTREVVQYGKKQYVVFVDSETDREVFIETKDVESEFDSY